MHYCQSCNEPTAMRPGADSSATCPICGEIDPTAEIAPLFVVTGASGSGKSAIFGPLASLLACRCVTFDVDWLIDPARRLAADRELSWPALRETWLVVAHGVAQSGMATVLLGPLIPDHLDRLPSRRWVGDISFLLLDCSDELRRERMKARPHWRDRDIDEQTEFAGWLRANVADRIDTTTGTLADVAGAVARWVTAHLPATR